MHAPHTAPGRSFRGISAATVPLFLAVLAIARPASAEDRRIEFADREWTVKARDTVVGPGPNHFSADAENVRVDREGRLHLAIDSRDGVWRCAEVISTEPVGYGEYEYRVGPGAEQLDPNVVLGFFTWNSDTWKTEANSEIDIELTRWSRAGEPNLHYSVHPTWGVGDVLHKERYYADTIDLHGEGSTHVVTWLPTHVELATYRGDDGPAQERLVAHWRYEADNPPRSTISERGQPTDPIAVPRPGDATTARINLWLFNGDRQGGGDAPTDGQSAEIVVTGFRFTPSPTAD